MALTTAAQLYKLGFQGSPIILTGGIASFVPGGMLPIIALTQAVDFTKGLLSGALDVDPDDLFAQFNPVPGGTLGHNEVATYPFANQTVAANSMIAQPKRVAMLMQCPAKGSLGFLTKLATMTALTKTLDLHDSQGGTYIVVTPAYIYTNCLRESMIDVSGSATRQFQYQYQLNFIQPLITAADAQTAQGALTSKLTSGTKLVGQPSWSSVSNAVPTSIGGAGQSFLSYLKSLIGTQQ